MTTHNVGETLQPIREIISRLCSVEVGHIRLYDYMIRIVIFHHDLSNCSWSQLESISACHNRSPWIPEFTDVHHSYRISCSDLQLRHIPVCKGCKPFMVTYFLPASHLSIFSRNAQFELLFGIWSKGMHPKRQLLVKPCCCCCFLNTKCTIVPDVDTRKAFILPGERNFTFIRLNILWPQNGMQCLSSFQKRHLTVVTNLMGCHGQCQNVNWNIWNKSDI